MCDCESYDMEEKMSFEEHHLNQSQEVIEVNKDSEEYLSCVKKVELLTEQIKLLRNFLLTRDRNVHSLHHGVPTFVLVQYCT